MQSDKAFVAGRDANTTVWGITNVAIPNWKDAAPSWKLLPMRLGVPWINPHCIIVPLFENCFECFFLCVDICHLLSVCIGKVVKTVPQLFYIICKYPCVEFALRWHSFNPHVVVYVWKFPECKTCSCEISLHNEVAKYWRRDRMKIELLKNLFRENFMAAPTKQLEAVKAVILGGHWSLF